MNALLTKIEELKQTGLEAKKMFPAISEITLRKKWPVFGQINYASCIHNEPLTILPESGVHALIINYPEGITVSIIHEK